MFELPRKPCTRCFSKPAIVGEVSGEHSNAEILLETLESLAQQIAIAFGLKVPNELAFQLACPRSRVS